MHRMPHALAVRGLALTVAASALVGCGKSPEGPTLDASSEKLLDLERRMNDLSQQREAGGLATGVSGSEFALVQRSLKEAQDRVKALEERLAALPVAPAPVGTAPADGSPAPLGGSTVPAAWTAGPDGAYTEEQLTAFGKLADEVQKRKDAAAMAERVKRELARAGVSLTPEQESAVLKLQQSYREKMQDLFKNGFGTNEAERSAAMEKRDALKNQFEADLRNSVPASEADKIVEAMKRGWPGFFPRQRQDAASGGGSTGGGGTGGRGAGMGGLGGG